MLLIWSFIAAGLLLFVPGYMMTRAVPGAEMDPAQRIIVAIILGLAVLPVLLLWSTLAGMAWGGPTTWLLIVVAALVMVWTWPKTSGPRQGILSWATQHRPYVLLAFIAVGSLFVRMVALDDLSIPSWGDSLHHTWIARLIAERGQVPDSYFPYFPLDSLTYHFGFHSMVAFFSWVSGLSVVQSVLFLGQILNALSAVTVYLLTLKLTRSQTAALVSALVTGLVSLMPAYYVNWGRYTQLAGQVILPVAAVLAIEAIERRHRGYLALAGIAAAGLFLTHYRVILFYVAFLAAYMAWRLWGRPGLRRAIEDIAWLSGVGIFALVLSAPRLWYLAVNLPKAEASVPQLSPAAWDAWMVGYNALGDINTYVSWPLLALGVAGLAAAIRQKHALAPVMGIWVILLFAMANAERLGLGRGAWLNNFAILIALYMPLSILIGWLSALLVSLLERVTRLAPYALAGVAIVAGVWGGLGASQIMDKQYVLATPADQRAMAWIRENTSINARFLVNSFFAYGGRFIVGSDGGWWLSYFTGRNSNVPIIMYGAESSPGQDYAAHVNALARSLQENVYTPDGAVLMKEEGITHIYVGEKRGFLDPARLQTAGHQPVYHEGPVWVFKVNSALAERQ